jgi:hypothetical protein
MDDIKVGGCRPKTIAQVHEDVTGNLMMMVPITLGGRID